MGISISGLLVDLVPSSPNLPHMNCMEDSKENYERYLGVRGLKYFFCQPYNSYHVSSENLVLNQLIIPKLIFFLILISYLVDIVLIL